MKKLITILFLLVLISGLSLAQITSAGTGDWSSTGTWVGGVVPGASDAVIIADGHTVTSTSALTFVSLTMQGTAKLILNGTFATSLPTGASYTFSSDAVIEYQGGGQTIADINYPNLVINASTTGTAKTWSPTANRAATSITVTQGIFAWGNGVTCTVSGNILVTANGTIGPGSSANRFSASGANRSFTLNGTARVTANQTQTGAATSPFSYQYSGFTTYTFAPTSWVSFRMPSTGSKTQGLDGISGSPFGNVEVFQNQTTENTWTLKSDFTLTGNLAFPRTNTGAMIVNFGSFTTKVGGAIQLNGSNNSTQTGGRTFNMGTSTLELNGTSAQNTLGGTDLPNTFNNLKLNNSSGLTVANAITVTGTLTLTSGRLSIGSNNLTLGATASVSGTFSASEMIVADGTGEVRKEFSSNPVESFTFPIGDNTGTAEYSPVTISSLTAGGYSSAYIGVRVVNAKHPNYTGIHRLNRYWVMSSSGITGMNCNASYTYLPADVVGTENNLKGMKYSSPTWTILGPVDNLNQIFTASGLTSFSDFTAASEIREILVDGNPSDWIGTVPGTSHQTTYSNGEFIYKGVPGDERTDYNGTQSSSDNDLAEFRVGTDGTWLYLLVKMRDITNVDYPHVCLVFSNGTSSQSFIGDDSKKNNTNGGASTGLANSQQNGRLVDIHSATTGNPVIEMYDGGTWYAPPTVGWATSFSTTNDVIEAKIALADLGITATSTTNISLMTAPNRVGYNNDVDGTAWGTEDQTNGVDVMTPGANDENAWFRDLSDGNVGNYFAVNLTNSPLPVELTSFNASAFGKDVKINWSTATEVNSYQFVVERSDNEVWNVVGTVNASGNSNSPKQYSFTDNNLQQGKYQYRLKMIDNDGSYEYSQTVEVDIDVPKEFALMQNYPNPFNPVTNINYTIPVDSKVMLVIYSISGEKVAELINETQSAGSYSIPFNAANLASGTYVYRLIANDFVQTKKMLLIK